MIDHGPDALSLPYDPSALAARVSKLRRQIRSRLISLGISVIVLVVLTVLRWQQAPGGLYVIVYVVVLAAGLAWLAAVWIGLRRARADLAEVTGGEAVRIDRAGVQVAGLAAGWPQVDRLLVVGAGLGRADRFALALTDGRTASVPLPALAIRPANLDTAARAYSSSRRGVDLSYLA